MNCEIKDVFPTLQSPIHVKISFYQRNTQSEFKEEKIPITINGTTKLYIIIMNKNNFILH